MSETPNHGYNTPAAGTENWNEPLNENFEQYDTDIELRDVDSNKDDYEPKSGAKFLATDTGIVYVGDGTTWNAEFVLPEYDAASGEAIITQQLSLDAISGTVTGGQTLENIAGNNLSIDSNGVLNASGGSSSSGISSLSGGAGINPNSISDGDILSVAWDDANTLDSNGTVNTGEYLNVTGDAVGFSAAAEWNGGGGNTANGSGSTVPGGQDNTASGAYSTALGRNATATNDGSFVVGDSSDTEVTSQNDDEARFQGEVVSESYVETSGEYEFTDSPMFLETFEDNDDNDTFSVSIIDPFGIPISQLSVNEFGDTVVGGDLDVDGKGTSNGDLNVGGDTVVSGDLDVDGNKNFVESVETDDGEKEVVYTASEAPKSRTEISGVATLRDGRTVIELPDHFKWVTSEDEPLHIQTTPYAAETSGLAVVERSTDRIVVEDLDGEGEYEFAYTIKGTRDGHEDKQVVREPTATDPSPTPADD